MYSIINFIKSFLSKLRTKVVPIEAISMSTVTGTEPVNVATSPVTSTLLPHQPVMDLSKWGLVPELEKLAVEFLIKCRSEGYDLRITQGLRTMEQQAALYAQGRNGDTRPIVTNAKPGQSLHNFGKAFDFCFNGLVAYPNDDAKWKAISDIGISCGLTPGYYFHSFQDKPHMEIK